MKERAKSLWNTGPKTCWQWLLYIDLALPALLFALALLLGPWASMLFHNYCLYIVNPVPTLSNLVGIPGLLIGLFFVGRALGRKRFLDAALSLGIVLLMALVFGMRWNNLLLPLLRFV